MHIRNLHKDGYDFDALVRTRSSLKQFVIKNPSGRETIDFAKSEGVKALNDALLQHYYGIEYWDIPKGYLCPPIPGRADYIHAIADLLGQSVADINSSKKAGKVKGLDIGTGANLIYPIIGSQSYGWQFVGTDIDKVAVRSAKLVQTSNANLRDLIEIRHQINIKCIFDGVVKPSDRFDFCMCNPPFHASAKAALSGTMKKNLNLMRNKNKRDLPKKRLSPKVTRTKLLNFEGQNNELWCKGGEAGFIKRMITESANYQNQIGWFTTLVSKKESIKPISKKLSEMELAEIKVVDMKQGNKASRFVAWRF